MAIRPTELTPRRRGEQRTLAEQQRLDQLKAIRERVVAALDGFGAITDEATHQRAIDAATPLLDQGLILTWRQEPNGWFVYEFSTPEHKG